MFVYSPESAIAWPDPRLGPLATSSDPAFPLPGNIGTRLAAPRLPGELRPDVLTSPTPHENQVHLHLHPVVEMCPILRSSLA